MLSLERLTREFPFSRSSEFPYFSLLSSSPLSVSFAAPVHIAKQLLLVLHRLGRRPLPLQVSRLPILPLAPHPNVHSSF